MTGIKRLIKMEIQINDLYEKLIEKIQKHRPHLNSNSTVVERALDYYLDEIVRLDKIGLGGRPYKFNVKEVIKND